MHPVATNRDALLRVVEGTLTAVQVQDSAQLLATAATAGVVFTADVESQRDEAVNALENAARTLRLHDELTTAADEQRATWFAEDLA